MAGPFETKSPCVSIALRTSEPAYNAGFRRDPIGYPRFALTTFLGLIGLVVFCAAVISLAASITWVVVKVIPADRGERKQEAASSRS
jgi:hypothetical protein